MKKHRLDMDSIEVETFAAVEKESTLPPTANAAIGGTFWFWIDSCGATELIQCTLY